MASSPYTQVPIYDPATGKTHFEVNTDGIGPEHRRQWNLLDARSALNTAAALAAEAPGFEENLAPVRAVVERADDADMAAEEARRLVRVRERERDAAERAAFREGKDPVASTEDARAALTAAREEAETADRLADNAAREALGQASRLRTRARKAATDAAPVVIRERLRKLDGAREDAREAIENAIRHMNRVSGLAANIHAKSTALPADDPLSALEIERGRQFNPQQLPAQNSNRPTVEAVQQEMRDIATNRFSYGDGGYARWQTIGPRIGKAVRMVAEEDAADDK